MNFIDLYKRLDECAYFSEDFQQRTREYEYFYVPRVPENCLNLFVWVEGDDVEGYYSEA